MKTPTTLSRTATMAGAVIAVALVVTFTMPAQAAYVADKAASSVRSAVMNLCQRFCGNHRHHHGHRWCGNGEDYWCPGH
ncbi:MAG TPA: hypothetical protein P5016_02380 [Verrucomicrobiales bacterium]|nr:hypothetical protein [Verrucomicrobiales bacterium]